MVHSELVPPGHPVAVRIGRLQARRTDCSRRDGSLSRHARIISRLIRGVSLQKYGAVCNRTIFVSITPGNILLILDVAVFVLLCDHKCDSLIRCSSSFNDVDDFPAAIPVFFDSNLFAVYDPVALKLSFFGRGISVDAAMKPSRSSGERDEEVGKEEEVQDFHGA